MSPHRPQPNVDAAELAKFGRLASRWWDPESEFKTLHDINPLRTGYIAGHVDLPSSRVLDVGCGGGLLAESMSSLGATVHGIDLSAEALRVARLHLIESGLDVHYEEAGAEEYAARHGGGFDVVTCLELLEHVPDPGSTVRACAALVRDGGTVFFSTINRNPKAWILAIVGAEYLLDLVPRGTHSYRGFIRPSELDRWARAAGLQLRELAGLHYDPFGNRYRIGPGVDVNYLAVYTKPPA